MSNETDWFKQSLKLGAALKRAKDQSNDDPKEIVSAYHEFMEKEKCGNTD